MAVDGRNGSGTRLAGFSAGQAVGCALSKDEDEEYWGGFLHYFRPSDGIIPGILALEEASTDHALALAMAHVTQYFQHSATPDVSPHARSWPAHLNWRWQERGDRSAEISGENIGGKQAPQPLIPAPGAGAQPALPLCRWRPGLASPPLPPGLSVGTEGDATKLELAKVPGSQGVFPCVVTSFEQTKACYRKDQPTFGPSLWCASANYWTPRSSHISAAVL